jgi:hypothetical protein
LLSENEPVAVISTGKLFQTAGVYVGKDDPACDLIQVCRHWESPVLVGNKIVISFVISLIKADTNKTDTSNTISISPRWTSTTTAIIPIERLIS